MINLSETIEVARDINSCYDYLLDFSTTEQWDPGVYRARKLSPGRVQPGSGFELILNTPAGHRPIRYELRSTQAPNQIELTGSSSRFSVHDRIELQALDRQHTRIIYRAEITFNTLAAAAEPLLRPWLLRMGKTAVQGLKRALQDPTPAHAPKLNDRIRSQLLAPGMLDFTERGYLRMPHKGLSQSMQGKTVLITGPTSGLGLAAACELARLGAHLILLGRDRERLNQAGAQIIDFAGRHADCLSTYEAELSSQREIRKVSADILAREGAIDVLINNAGALPLQREMTEEGHEYGLAINLLAPYLLTSLLLPRLQQSAARVINVASGGLYLQALNLKDMNFLAQPYDGSKAYARHKRALVTVTQEWARMPACQGVSFYSMHPGWASTPGVAKSLPRFNRVLEKHLRDARMGADTICWLASSRALDGRHNGLFWFDRRPQVDAILPGTAVAPSKRKELLAFLAMATEQTDAN